MKKILLLLTVAFFLSCETKTVEVEKTAGMVYYGQNKGGTFELGSDESVKIAVAQIIRPIARTIIYHSCSSFLKA